MKMRTLSLGSAALLMVTVLTASVASAKPPTDKGNNKSNGAACVAATPTPTATPVPGATPTPTPSPTPSPTPTPTPTPTPGATPTPTATPAASPTPKKVASFHAKVTPGHPCGKIHVQAKVHHASRSKTFTAFAVAHFTGGDVTIQLRRSGKSFVAGGHIPVPAGQAAGPVLVDITIVYGGVSQTKITRTSTIKAP